MNGTTITYQKGEDNWLESTRLLPTKQLATKIQRKHVRYVLKLNN